MDPLRDRIFGLLSDLCGPQHEVSPDALRLLSHTLLGVARDHAPSALFAVRDALPYVVALVEACDGADATTTADMLVSRGVIRALTRDAVARRIESARSPRLALGATVATPVEARLAGAMRDLATLDLRMMGLSMRSAQSVRDELLEQPELFASAVDLCLGEETSEVGIRFAQAFAMTPDPRSGAALATLSDLESSWDGGALRANVMFSERTRRFELSTADHLRQAGFLPAVQAALAFGPAHPHSASTVRPSSFATFATFANDRCLDELAVALASARGAVFAYLRGQVPLQSLDGWVAYVRGPCSDLAEQHDISIREAMSFAHFCLHLMNFCDLTAHADADDALRLAMMSVEEELKEFALAAQREGLKEDASLTGLERSHYRSIAVRDRVAERLGRLAGGWADGFGDTHGGPPLRLNPRALAPWRRLLSEWDGDGAIAQFLDHRWRDVTFVASEALSDLPPQQALSALIIALNAAAPHTSHVSFEDLAERLAKDGEVVRAMLQAMPPNQLVGRDERRVAHGLTAVVEGAQVRLVWRYNGEFEALALLSRSSETPLELRLLAQRRMAGLLGDELMQTPREVPALGGAVVFGNDLSL